MLTPLKSLTLGNATLNNLVAKSYILSLLRVTLQPIFIPSLNLKAAIDFLALVIIGFCPVINVKSDIATSKALEFSFTSDTPIFITILSNLGTCITDL